jgi:hypothetical protein
VLDPGDEAGDAEAAQVVGHLAGGVRGVEQSGHQGAAGGLPPKTRHRRRKSLTAPITATQPP